jgi:hypothetical protein
MSDIKDNKERKCDYCNDSGVVERYNKDGDVYSKLCPRCTDELSHIRDWDGHGHYR